MAVNGAGGLAMVFLLSAFGFPKKRGMACLIAALASAVLTLALSQSIWMPLAFIVLACFCDLYETNSSIRLGIIKLKLPE